MSIDRLANTVTRFARGLATPGEVVQTSLPELRVLRHDAPTTFEAVLYQPVACLILQGRKETVLGDRTVSFGAGDTLIVSHDLPVVSRVTEASRETPYVALILGLDPGILRSLCDEIGETAVENTTANAIDAHATDPELLSSLERFFALVDRPLEARVMAPLILREIHFRLLMAPHGAMLRNLLLRDSHASKIERAIRLIRRDFRSTLSVSELADAAGMSASSFHEHFKSVTATTPLRYQKELRLLEARRLLSEGARSVASVAFDVGYQSPAQFSREYARKFGVPPRQDLSRPLVPV